MPLTLTQRCCHLLAPLIPFTVVFIHLSDDDGVRQVFEEMRGLYDQNVAAANDSTADPDGTAISSIAIRHAALERNKRCLMAYVFNRSKKLRNMRWQFGSILPPEIKANLCEPEIQWFNSYSKCLARYMKSIGGQGLNLAQDVKPPKSLYVEVRSLIDYGKFELDNGEVVLLKKHSTHLMSRAQCEPLIIQGVLEQINH
ncbi:DNA replication complex GINS protein PSF1-like isoform X1 [Frankliniella occidentalis]|uniref:DNA replication complex GINS protein PSF1 n=1 Tax=Frankliniella occidentalis TaxID=133901 RepID=A0A9C6U1W5_FRAOC|nr:DNA replication complex GINS protein PSF1-like isoform X1 [Frankliniella occidentalis]